MAPDVILNSSKTFCITFHLLGETGTTTKNTKTQNSKKEIFFERRARRCCTCAADEISRHNIALEIFPSRCRFSTDVSRK